MSENRPLQARAGLNIGIEPDVGQFLQDCGGKEVLLSSTIGAETVLMECPPKTARTPIPLGGAQGIIFNTTAVEFFYVTYYRDVDGNEIPLIDPTSPESVAANSADVFEVHDGRLDETGFTLTPGEKIILRRVAAPAPPV